MMLEDLSLKEARELLQNGGAFRAETGTMTLLMWHAGRGCYALELTPQGSPPAATAACGLENIVATMTGYAPAASWTALDKMPT
jgi:hypothetical protein